MGYQMPIVCKEVYLPINSAHLGDSIATIDEYKREYGVDLKSLFDWKQNGNVPHLAQPVKIFVVFDGGVSDYDNCVFPAILVLGSNTVTIFAMVPAADSESTYTKNADRGIVINFLTDAVSLYEI